MFKNLTYSVWREWNELETCAELEEIFVQQLLTGMFYQLTPYKHDLVFIFYTAGKTQSAVVKSAMIWYRSRE